MIERLDAHTPIDIERIGGKGCGLVRLMAAGLRVPDAWYVPADVDVDDPTLRVELEALAAAQPETRFAVRSSATAEDLAAASFAGVYTTLLGVRGAPALGDAIRTCRASLRTEAAVDYRIEKAIGEDVRMAVLIQRLVEPDVAGVLLTANPQRAFAQEIVIDAVYGLGEALAAGRTDPDHLVLDRTTGVVREQRIGAKRIALRCGAGSEPIEVAVAESDRARACLCEQDRGQLFALAQQITRTIGPRMDVEWAIESGELHVLQVRPIVGLPPTSPTDIWSRKFGDEYMADYTTPAGYSFLVDWIRRHSFSDPAEQIGNRALQGMEPLRRHKGYVYFSGRYACVNARGVPLESRADALRGWFPDALLERLHAEPFELRLLIRTLLLPLRVPGATMRKNVAALARHAQRIMSEVAPRLGGDYAALSDAELAGALREVDALGHAHFGVIRWGMGQYAPLFHGMLERSLETWVGEGAEALYQELVSGQAGTHTAEINRDVHRLGAIARANPALCVKLRAGGECDALRASAPDPAFWNAFDGFIERHGHRGATRDIAEPRWRESPGLILTLVRAQLAGDVPPPDPETLEAASAERRRAAEGRTLTALGGGPHGWLRRRLFRWMYRHCLSFTVYRENQRYYLDVILAELRNLVLEHGRRLATRGVLDDPWSAFLLEKAELVACFAGEANEADLGGTLAARRDHYDTWHNRLPATYLYDDVETEGEAVEGDPLPGAEAPASAGLGASRGVARGRLRVLRDIRELDRVERGEILVAENIDPGWTSVFPMLAGLVTETGGVLSHGALLAREYGIPAVMGVRDATLRFETGAWVEIDGGTGSLLELDSDAL